MANVFEITAAMRTLARQSFDDLMDQLGKPFVVVYPAGRTTCPNCRLGPDGRSAGVYLPGGPTPFPDYGVCPVCFGDGVTGAEVTEAVTMSVAENPAEWWVPFPPAQVAAGMIQTKCYQTDLTKLLRARRIRRGGNLAGHTPLEYELAGPPADTNSVVPDRYAVLTWKRA